MFCDLDERTLTADPDDVESRITPRTKAICVVHVWGNPARMDRFVDIARRHGVALIEDCSHAHGATYGGRPVGTWGDIGCFSLQGNKPVSGGEAGIAITEDAALLRPDAGPRPHRPDRPSAGRRQLRHRRHQLRSEVPPPPRRRPVGAVAACAGSTSSTPGGPATTPCWSTRSSDTKAVTPIETYPDAVRGGYFEFVFRYDPDHAGGWPIGAFVQAARAEGVPVAVDRYTRQGRPGDAARRGAAVHDGRLRRSSAASSAAPPVVARSTGPARRDRSRRRSTTA